MIERSGGTLEQRKAASAILVRLAAVAIPENFMDYLPDGKIRVTVNPQKRKIVHPELGMTKKQEQYFRYFQSPGDPSIGFPEIYRNGSDRFTDKMIHTTPDFFFWKSSNGAQGQSNLGPGEVDSARRVPIIGGIAEHILVSAVRNNRVFQEAVEDLNQQEMAQLHAVATENHPLQMIVVSWNALSRAMDHHRLMVQESDPFVFIRGFIAGNIPETVGALFPWGHQAEDYKIGMSQGSLIVCPRTGRLGYDRDTIDRYHKIKRYLINRTVQPISEMRERYPALSTDEIVKKLAENRVSVYSQYVELKPGDRSVCPGLIPHAIEGFEHPVNGYGFLKNPYLEVAAEVSRKMVITDA